MSNTSQFTALNFNNEKKYTDKDACAMLDANMLNEDQTTFYK